MRELTLEIPLPELPLADGITTSLLENLLKSIEFTYLIRIRGDDFLMICRVSPHSELRNLIMKRTLSDRIRVKLLDREESGAEVLQISGTWKQLFLSTNEKAEKMVEFMKSVKRKPIFITRDPCFQSGMLRIAVLGEHRTIANLLEEIKHLDIAFRVAGLSSKKACNESPLATLTARQASILKMAHSLGYYDIPKKARVEDIARLLGIDKGTVGEHLQRAEKHVFDQLLQ